MDKKSSTLELVLQAVALGMAIASIVLGILKTAPTQTNVLLLGIGLFALAMSALSKEK
jgi:uncharacterized membrane protein